MNSKIEILESRLKEAESRLKEAEQTLISLLEDIKNHHHIDNVENDFTLKCISYDAAFYRLEGCNRGVVRSAADLFDQQARDAHEIGEYQKFMNENYLRTEATIDIYQKYPRNLEDQIEARFAKLVFNN